MEYSTAVNSAIYLLVFFFGLSVGSFLNVVIYRLPREGLSVSRPKRSFCPGCGADINWYDNIPVFSWIFLRARCRACRRPIAFRYPLVELSAGLLSLYLFHRFGASTGYLLYFHRFEASAVYLLYFYFAMCLLAIALIDLELMVIPTVLMYPTTALGLLCAVLAPDMALAGPALWAKLEPVWGPHLSSLAGSALGLLLGWGSLWLVSRAYKIVRGHEGMGDGDPPLLGMIGAFLGWRAVPLVILWSTLIGIFSVAILMLMAKGKPPEEGWGMKALPFGPFLVLAAFLYLFFGPAFMAWYWSLMS